MTAARRIYFFSDTKYMRFDEVRSGVNLGFYPQDIATRWPGMPAGPIDAAFNWGANFVYFFVADQYYKWNVRQNRMMPNYPKAIAGNWPGVAGTGFENGIDAAINWGNGKIYWFKGSKYLRMSWPSGAVDTDTTYPKDIAGNWAGFDAVGFDSNIDAAVNRGNGKMYFFKAGKYLRFTPWDNATSTGNTIDSTYPKDIGPNWGGVFAGGVNCAVEWPMARVDPAGFRIPVNVGAWNMVAGSVAGTNRSQLTFDLEIDFINTSYPESWPVGEYRQYIRGVFMVGGVALNHPLPVPGGAPITMRNRPAAGAADTNFREDGIEPPLAGLNVFYGHRDETTPGNADTTDTYLPEREWGGTYRGNDTPSVQGPIGLPFAISLDFRGVAVDRASSDAEIRESFWNINNAGTF